MSNENFVGDLIMLESVKQVIRCSSKLFFRCTCYLFKYTDDCLLRVSHNQCFRAENATEAKCRKGRLWSLPSDTVRWTNQTYQKSKVSELLTEGLLFGGTNLPHGKKNEENEFWREKNSFLICHFAAGLLSWMFAQCTFIIWQCTNLYISQKEACLK